MREEKKRARSAGNAADSKINNILYFSAWAGVVSTVITGWHVDGIATGIACLLSAAATIGIFYYLIGGENERD